VTPLALFALLSESVLTDAERGLVAAHFPYGETGEGGLRQGVAHALAVAGLDSRMAKLGPRWPSPGLLDRARARVQTWRTRGVSCVTSDDLNRTALPPFLFARGKTSLLDKPLAAVLHSRKPRSIRPADRWVRVTRHLTETVLSEGAVPVASLGSAAYELVLATALRAGCSAGVVLDGPLPFMESESRLTRFLDDYGDMVPEERVLLLSPFSPGRLPPVKARQPQRDACLVALCDRVLAAEIRSGGVMEGLIREAQDRGQTVRIFRPACFDRAVSGNRALLEDGLPEILIPGIEEEPQTKSPASSAETDSRPLNAVLPGPESVIHFTRACHGPWPGQTRTAYYGSLLDARPESAHAALDTLCHILEEGRIRASTRLVRGDQAVVSFTGRSLADLRSLVRWRRGLIRWTFEPYGLAVHKKALLDLGLSPVIYGPESVWRDLSPRDRFRYQAHRPPDTDWSAEDEWRLPGDLDLSALPAGAVRVIVSSDEEAARIEARFGYAAAVAPR